MKGIWFVCLFSVASAVFGAGEDVNKLLDKRLSQEAVDQAKQEEAILAQRERQAFLNSGREVMAQADRLIATITEWEGTTAALLTNEKGRLIAANDPAVEQFMLLQKAERMSLIDAKSIRTGLDTLLVPAATAKDEDRYVPTDKLRKALEEDSRRIQTANNRYQALNNQLNAILGQTVTIKPGAIVLQEAIQNMQFKEGQDALAKKQKEEADKRATEQAKQESLEAERKRQAELDRQKQIELEKLKREHERKLQEAKNPELVARYAPFLGKSNHILKGPNAGESRNKKARPDRNGHWPRTKDDRLKPLSLGILNSWNALNDVGIFSSIIFVSHNDRPNGDFKQPATEADWQEMEKRMKEFARYAPFWVEANLLED